MTRFLGMYFWHAFIICGDVILPFIIFFHVITACGLALIILFSYFLYEISFPELCSGRRLGLDSFAIFTKRLLLLFSGSIKNMAVCFQRFQTSISLLIFIWTFSLNIFIVSDLLSFDSTPKSVESSHGREPRF